MFGNATELTQLLYMDTKITLTALDQNPLFAVLTSEERIILQRAAALNTFTKHQVLYKPGQPAGKVFFLLQGVVKVAVHAEKKDIIKYVVRPGNLFGESCLTGESQRRDFAYAMDDQVEALEIDSTVLLAVRSPLRIWWSCLCCNRWHWWSPR